MDNYNKVKAAMLGFSRLSWEQGFCAQALYEAGDLTYIAMAHDAVIRQTADGRLGVTGENIAVTDPAANGEAVLRAYEHTGNVLYKSAADKMLAYLMQSAPRTDGGLICHNEVSFHEGFTPKQIWADSLYMLPPFLSLMGEVTEARKQLDGYLDALTDPETGLLFHIYDAGSGRFVRPKLWATGNGWALLGLARMGDRYRPRAKALLNAMLTYSTDSGIFHDVLDDCGSFEDATSSMMTAAFIYRAIAEGWLSREYAVHADKVYEGVQHKIDEYGIIQGVSGSPHFVSVGTSAEAQAAYILMHTWRERYEA
ncbi:MAG: glycoside hydrolase family 88 protein [Oscillospiraceae bacterium]|nr:glycoside hydrolase family 88 protein [Oscillospiraceae bacterium]